MTSLATTTTGTGPLGSLASRFPQRWWALAIVGVAWIVIGFVVLRFDSASVAIVGVLAGLMVLLAAATETFRAVMTPGGWRFWHGLAAVVLVIAAIFLLARPDRTFVSFASVIGLYFVFAGTFDVISSLFVAGRMPGWWLQLLSGIAQVVLGYIASSSYQSGVVVLVTWVSVTAIFRGIAEISAAFALRAMATA